MICVPTMLFVKPILEELNKPKELIHEEAEHPKMVEEGGKYYAINDD
jgi:hypothetical protein